MPIMKYHTPINKKFGEITRWWYAQPQSEADSNNLFASPCTCPQWWLSKKTKLQLQQ